MSEEILINVTPQETRVAVMQLGVVQDLHIERGSSRGIVSNVYLGKVKRVLPGMQSAFIDIGLERSAFLHVADIWENSHNGDTAKPIEKVLFEGQTLLVQVIKEPIGSKGARLSTQLSIAGRLLVYLPQETHIGVSQRIESEEQREALRARSASRAAAGASGRLHHPHRGGSVGGTGFCRRHRLSGQAVGQSAGCCQNRQRAATAVSGTRHQPARAARFRQPGNHAHPGRFAQHLPEDAGIRASLQSRSRATSSSTIPASRPLFDLYGVEEEIERALSKRVDLKSGGYLIIDQTEALTTIDVNTGGFVGLRNFDDTIFKTNLEATQVIARQLRLRNLGGIIICDFIDMDTQEHRDAVLEEFKKALARDHTRITVNGFSSLGLVEMTRKRTRESLAHVMCEPCPTCQGRGEVKTAQTVCYEILREILREARQFNAREYRILGSQQVIDLFLDEESQALAMLSDFIAKPISMQVETMYSQEQYDVILM